MENQDERNAWNERWLRQIALWQTDLEDLLDEAETRLGGLIKLAVSQLKQDPPE